MRTAMAILILWVLACSDPHVDIIKLHAKNPTTFVFPKTLEEVETAIAEAFADFSYREMFIEILSNHRGARLYNYHMPISLSPVYRVGGKELPYLAEFLLQIEPSPKGVATRVSVIASQTKVIAGKTSGFLNPHGPANIYVSVDSTSIEEYEILQILGGRLGVLLPPSVTPSSKEFDIYDYIHKH